MHPYVYRELQIGALQAFRTVIPASADRIPVTWQTAPSMILHHLPLVFMAYLVRRPDTYIIRLLLLPTVLSAILRMTFSFHWTDPQLNVYNWGLSLLGLYEIGRALDFAFARHGRLKVGEKVPGEMYRRPTPPSHATNAGAHTNGDAHIEDKLEPKDHTSSLFPLWLEDAIEMLCAVRGIGWDFGHGVYVPKEWRSTERTKFLLQTLKSFAIHFFLLDFQESLLKLVPGVGSPFGGTIFLPLPLYQRYALSTAIHILTGSCILSGFIMVYDLLTLIDVGLLRHSPLSWPPIVENPWGTHSLHEFWAKRWHQILRQTFMVYGGIPGKWIAGNPGMVVGMFLASGMYHEYAIDTMGRGLDHRVTFFFCLQGVMMFLERFWRKFTGKRVEGWPGTIWVYFVIMVLGQPCVDAWHLRGLAGGMVIFPVISPTRLVIFPAVRHILNAL
ncbi:hypothetical protein JAAARDRAFT_149394 [Jaapia argillacea MUCL 33604]|uniref:Wax synthase domain-containing protein n=1 Tax=Jaapia argillacea MUCL 33604 TaxID=933084 RepID=A0A067Q8L5_9AGAM|nr:hypothetical protein JAAARDRAFT_149394 [Jaapia argillacea MUCL 33604]